MNQKSPPPAAKPFNRTTSVGFLAKITGLAADAFDDTDDEVIERMHKDVRVINSIKTTERIKVGLALAVTILDTVITKTNVGIFAAGYAGYMISELQRTQIALSRISREIKKFAAKQSLENALMNAIYPPEAMAEIQLANDIFANEGLEGVQTAIDDGRLPNITISIEASDLDTPFGGRQGPKTHH